VGESIFCETTWESTVSKVTVILEISIFGFGFYLKKAKIKILNRSSKSVTGTKLKFLINNETKLDENFHSVLFDAMAFCSDL
jgi:hypothetical protein